MVANYPDVPRLVALKIDVQRRGVHYTERAEAAVDPAIHQLRSPYIFGSRDGQIKPLPESLILREGTSILTDPTPVEQNPCIVNLLDGRFALMDDGESVEYVDLWPKPRYYDLKTSSGVPMSHVASTRPQRLNIFQSSDLPWIVVTDFELVPHVVLKLISGYILQNKSTNQMLMV